MFYILNVNIWQEEGIKFFLKSFRTNNQGIDFGNQTHFLFNCFIVQWDYDWF